MWSGPIDCHIGAATISARARVRLLGARVSDVAAFEIAAANGFAAGAARRFLAGAARIRAAFAGLVRFGNSNFRIVALGMTSVATTSLLSRGSRSARYANSRCKAFPPAGEGDFCLTCRLIFASRLLRTDCLRCFRARLPLGRLL